MTVPPLFDPLDSEDEDQLRRDAAPRDAVFEAGSGPGVGDDNSPAGTHPRLWAWLHVEPFYWTMRVVYVCLAAGAIFAVYINGVAEGWWRAWGEKPSVAATTPATQPAPTASPSASGEAAMSGGYQIGPDGVLVRPAQFAADTYTKPELPEEAKENTERGAEAAAEHYLAVATYAWNTGDTSEIAAVSDAESGFAQSLIKKIDDDYANGWTYGHSLTVDHVLVLEPVPANETDVPPNTIGVKFSVTAVDGTKCSGNRIVVSDKEYQSTISLFMTWRDNRWVETQGRAESHER
ncbi:DUF6318 family protein [Pauljensenia sp. 27098_8_83]